MLEEIDKVFSTPSENVEVVPKASPKGKKRIKIMIAVPHLGKMVTSLETKITKWIMERDYDVAQLFRSSVPVSANRNGIVAEFLKTDCDFLLMIDSDTIPTQNPLDLIKHDKDIVSGATPVWKEGGYAWAVGRKAEDGSYNQYASEERKGLRQVDGVGASCLMVKRKVYETIKIPFMEKFNEIGERGLGEDLHFCERAIAAGFEVWCDWNMICDHAKEILLLSVIQAIMNTHKAGIEKGKSLTKN